VIVSPAVNKDPVMHGPSCSSGSQFITDAAAKLLKMQHIFAYNGHPWGLSPRDLTFLESCRRADVKL